MHGCISSEFDTGEISSEPVAVRNGGVLPVGDGTPESAGWILPGKSVIGNVVIRARVQRQRPIGICAARGQVPIGHGTVPGDGFIRVRPLLDAAVEGALKRDVV